MKILKKKDFYILLLLGALYGLGAGLIIAGFMKLLEISMHFIWVMLPGLASIEGMRFLPLIIMLIGGLLVGLMRKHLGDTPKPMHEAVEDFSETGGFPYRNLPQSTLTALTSLTFGASLGPEAALISLLGGIASLTADTFGRHVDLAALFPGRDPKDRKWLAIPGASALIVMGVTIALIGGMGGFIFDFGTYTFNIADLLYGGLIGAIAVFGGLLFKASGPFFDDLTSPLKDKPVLQSIIGGLILGLAGSFLPETLFSGQKVLQPIFEAASSYGYWMLILIAVANIFVTRISLAAGWMGGQFFPLMLSGSIIGLAIAQILPGVTPLGALVAGMSGLTLGVMKNPLVVIIIVVLMMPKPTAGVIVTATLGAYVVIKMIELGENLRPKEETPALEIGD